MKLKAEIYFKFCARSLVIHVRMHAEKVIREKEPHLLVLDEINLAVHCKLLDANEVLELLNKVPEKTDVVLTGRYTPKELVERSDFVNEVVDVKYPEIIPTTRGIQY